MYTITIDENGSLRDFAATKEQVDKILGVLIPKVKKPKVPQLPYNHIGNADFGNDIFDDDGNLDLDCVQDYLQDGDYCQWDDRTGEKDNKKPFRLLINNKYLIEFIVEQGECIEATWDSRIWRADCSVFLISEDESVKDVEKKVIVPPVPPAPIVLAANEMLLFGKATKVLNICPCSTAKTSPHKIYPMSESQEVPTINRGRLLYDVRELERTLIFKMDENDEHYFMTLEKDWVEPTKYRNV